MDKILRIQVKVTGTRRIKWAKVWSPGLVWRFIFHNRMLNRICTGSILMDQEWEKLPSTSSVTWPLVNSWSSIQWRKLWSSFDFILGLTKIEFDAQPNTTVTGCNGRECFSKTVTYYAEMNQIKALIGISSECHQSISVKSFNLFHNFKSITLALNVSIRASSHHCTMPVSRTLRGWIGMEMPSITGPKMTRRTPPVTVESIRVASILCYCATVTL